MFVLLRGFEGLPPEIGRIRGRAVRDSVDSRWERKDDAKLRHTDKGERVFAHRKAMSTVPLRVHDMMEHERVSQKSGECCACT